MAFLGIDQSLRAAGMCLLSDEGHVQTLLTVNPRTRREGARLAYIRDQAKELLQQDVRHLAMEGYAFNATSQHFSLGEIGGVIKLLAFDLNVSVTVVTPVALKKFATGSPRADKEQMIAAAQRLSVRPRDDNQADAYFLSRVAYFVGRGENPETRAQMEVVHRVSHPTPKRVLRVRKLCKNGL